MTGRTGGRAAIAAGLLLIIAASVAAAAEDVEKHGQVTGLPIPRYVSMKANEGNARRGPSLSHRIDWVYRRKDLPLRITAEHGHWRRVEDRDGAGGWVHYSLLSGVRTVLFEKESRMRMKPVEAAPVVARVEPGVVGRLGECEPDWCRVRAGGYRGWVTKDAVWGVDPDEIRD